MCGALCGYVRGRKQEEHVTSFVRACRRRVAALQEKLRLCTGMAAQG